MNQMKSKMEMADLLTVLISDGNLIPWIGDVDPNELAQEAEEEEALAKEEEEEAEQAEAALMETPELVIISPTARRSHPTGTILPSPRAQRLKDDSMFDRAGSRKKHSSGGGESWLVAANPMG